MYVDAIDALIVCTGALRSSRVPVATANELFACSEDCIAAGSNGFKDSRIVAGFVNIEPPQLPPEIPTEHEGEESSAPGMPIMRLSSVRYF